MTGPMCLLRPDGVRLLGGIIQPVERLRAIGGAVRVERLIAAALQVSSETPVRNGPNRILGPRHATNVYRPGHLDNLLGTREGIPSRSQRAWHMMRRFVTANRKVSRTRDGLRRSARGPMKPSRLGTYLLGAAAFALVLLAPHAAESQVATTQVATTIDEAAAPGNNYDKAEFRLWYPKDVARLQGVVVLVPGSNGDGRPSVDDAVWQTFATSHNLALLGCRFTDKPHDQGFIEEYVNASHGSGQALLDALGRLATRAAHPELETAPLLLWGMSAGGQFNYEFVAWKPERVIAFVVNKGGIYYSALLPRAARNVPGILFVGGKDLAFRTNTIVGLFAVNRRAGALWALAEEPSAAHVVGRSRELAIMLFEDVLPLRLPQRDSSGMASATLRPMAERSGFLGNLESRTFQRQGDADAPGYPTAWLPTLRVAEAWRALVTEKPFNP
jgi:poly(3-hydroxybutyrate) depolymerase